MIKLSTYKNRPAVIVETKILRATFLHEDGAKLASLIRLDTFEELLAVKKGENYERLTYDGSYVDSECSGFDDMFPTVDEYTPESGSYKGVTYPDHGETCRIPYDITLSENEVIFTANSKRFPIRYEKIVTVEENAVKISYSIKNDGKAPFKFLWAGHIMLKGSNDTVVLTPFNDNDEIEFMFCGECNDKNALPKNRLLGYSPTGVAYKFYYVKPIPNGYFGLKYGDGSKLNFTYDNKKLPYLGLWLNNGEFQNLYTITPEPCTLPYDRIDRAEKRKLSSEINGESQFNFDIKISLIK